MLYREIIAVCSQIHTKHINTLCGQNVEFVNVKLAVHVVTTGLQGVEIDCNVCECSPPSWRVSVRWPYQNSTRTLRSLPPILSWCRFPISLACRQCSGVTMLNSFITIHLPRVNALFDLHTQSASLSSKQAVVCPQSAVIATEVLSSSQSAHCTSLTLSLPQSLQQNSRSLLREFNGMKTPFCWTEDRSAGVFRFK